MTREEKLAELPHYAWLGYWDIADSQGCMSIQIRTSLELCGGDKEDDFLSGQLVAAEEMIRCRCSEALLAPHRHQVGTLRCRKCDGYMEVK